MSESIDFQHRKVFDFKEVNAQGIAYACDNYWFLSSQAKIFKYRIDGTDLFHPTQVRRQDCLTFDKLQRETGQPFDGDHYNHLGGISFHNGLLFVPAEYKDHKQRALLLALSKDLELVCYSRLVRKNKTYEYIGVGPSASRQQPEDHYRPGELHVPSKRHSTGGYYRWLEEYDNSAPWCSVNPQNGHLYMSGIGSVKHLDVYDVSAMYQVLPDAGRWGSCVDITPLPDKCLEFNDEHGRPATVENIQGAAFSEDGEHLYTSHADRDTYLFGQADRWRNYINLYDISSVAKLRGTKEYNFDGIGDEMEGITVHPSGIIYSAVCINGTSNNRDIFEVHAFKHSSGSGVIKGGGGGNEVPKRQN